MHELPEARCTLYQPPWVPLACSFFANLPRPPRPATPYPAADAAAVSAAPQPAASPPRRAGSPGVASPERSVAPLQGAKQVRAVLKFYDCRR